MPASRNPEAPCNLDDLPRPNLSIADLGYIQLMSKQYGIVGKPSVPPDNRKTDTTCSKTSESSNLTGSKPVVTKSDTVASSNILNTPTQTVTSNKTGISNPKVKSTVVNRAVVNDNPWFPKIEQTKTGYSENYVPKGETSSKLHQPVTAAQETQKPIIVTSKSPFDGFCRRSPTSPMVTSRSSVADRKNQAPEEAVVHGPSDLRTTPMSKSSPNSVSTSVTGFAESARPRSSRSRSPQSTSRNKYASSSGTGTTSSTSSSTRTECVPPRQSSAGRTDTQENSSIGRGAKKEQKKKRKRKNNARLAQDVDNYVGDKSIEELLKFIEG